jgi:hypothetical protein
VKQNVTLKDKKRKFSTQINGKFNNIINADENRARDSVVG